jgi:enoyl-[acyl-carrier protein] reductase II
MGNAACDRFGIEFPILQGPMAWASDSTMSAAVSNAGGLGIMGIGFAPANVFKSEIVKIKSLTDKPFGCNLITAVPYARELLEIILKEKVPVVELETMPAFYGSLPDFTKKLKDNGTVVVGKVASVQEAVVLEKAGVDFISVKGADGGGHIYGYTGTFSLIPQVVDSVSIPVINSSGVADARGVAASFALGACAVEIGSRFLLAHECPVHTNYKKAIIEAKEGDTVLTGASIHDAVRGLRNGLADKVLRIEKQFEGDEAAQSIQKICSGSLRKAAVDGETENEGSVVVGQVVGMLNKTQSVQEIFDELVRGLQATSGYGVVPLVTR